MPIYEYNCEYCYAEFEVERPVAMVGGITECPVCGSAKTRRVFSPPAAIVVPGRAAEIERQKPFPKPHSADCNCFSCTK